MAETSGQEDAATRDDFVHLHVHTDYSMLDGAGKVKDYVAEAKRLGQPALAITDHGYMFGAYELRSRQGRRYQADHRRRGLHDPRHLALRQDPHLLGR